MYDIGKKQTNDEKRSPFEFRSAEGRPTKKLLPLLVSLFTMVFSVYSLFATIDDVFRAIAFLGALVAIGQWVRDKQRKSENPYTVDDSPEIAPD